MPIVTLERRVRLGGGPSRRGLLTRTRCSPGTAAGPRSGPAAETPAANLFA